MKSRLLYKGDIKRPRRGSWGAISRGALTTSRALGNALGTADRSISGDTAVISRGFESTRAERDLHALSGIGAP
jgi:hypothetical protein